MHILYLISSLRFGGAEKIAVGLAEEASRRGHKATILAVGPGNDFGRRLARHGVDYRTMGFDRRFCPTNAAPVARLRRRLVRSVSQLAPDVIHSQLFTPRMALYGMRRVAGCPVVQTQQDNPPWWRRGDARSRMQRHVDRVFARRTARYTAAISRSVQRDLQRLFGLTSDRCPLIYNFMDPPPSDLAPRKRRRKRTRVCLVSRLQWEKKGLDTAVEVFAKVVARLPGASLTVVGDGPDAGRLRRFVAERRLDDHVDFRGYQRDVYSHYAEADVLLMPSRWEGFGISAAEAAAVGLPVVAGRVGGLQEVVLDDQTGFTCEPEDIDTMADRVLQLLSDDELYERLSQNARQSVRTRFSTSAAFDQYEGIYHRAANEAA